MTKCITRKGSLKVTNSPKSETFMDKKKRQCFDQTKICCPPCLFKKLKMF